MAAILTISVIAVIPAVAENNTNWLTMATWDGEEDVAGSAPTSFSIDKGNLSSVAVREITNYLKDDTATNPYFSESTKGVVLYNDKNGSTCTPASKSTPGTLTLDSEKMADATDLRICMLIKDTTYTESFNVGVVIDDKTYYAPVEKGDFTNFGLYTFSGKTMTAMDDGSTIALSAENISKVTKLAFWVQTSGYSAFFLDTVEYLSGSVETTASTTVETSPETTTASTANYWITLADWDGEQDVEGSVPTSFAIDKGALGSVAVRPITYYLKDDSATNPLFPSSAKGVVLYNQKPNVCNPTDKSTPATMDLGTALPSNAKDLRVCLHIKASSYTEQFNIGAVIGGKTYYAPLDKADYANFGYYTFAGKTMTAVDGGTIELSEDNVGTITKLAFWVQTNGYSSIFLDTVEYLSDTPPVTQATTASAVPTTSEPTTAGTTIAGENPIEKMKSNMNLVWSDEFEGDKLNLDNWYYEHRDINSPRNNQLHHYNDKIVDNGADNGNVKVENGNLVITAKKEQVTDVGSDGKTYTREYTSGGIRSQDQINGGIKQSFRYGVIEARVKMPETAKNALWTAVWMVGVNEETGKSSWPYHGETDIIEYLSKYPNKQMSNLIFNNKYDDPTKDPDLVWDENGNCIGGYDSARNKETVSIPGKYYTLPNNQTYGDGFHKIGYIWTDTYVQFYVDDVIVQTVDITDPKFDVYRTHDFSFIINIAVGGHNVTNAGGFDGSDLANPKSEATNSMYVDYVRVYQSHAPELESANDTSITLKSRAGYEYSIDGKNWQDSNVFGSLEKGTKYSFYQRLKSSADMKYSDTSVAAEFSTTNGSVPTSAPTNAPTSAPTNAPTSAPTSAPTNAPTSAPTSATTSAPTSAPTNAPTTVQTTMPITVNYGDLNSDGKINLFDLIAMRKYLAKWSITVDLDAADCNADGKINLFDLILMRKYLAKWSVHMGPQG